jgi:hypothetical protein
MSDLSKLSDRELDARCAKLRGWVVKRDTRACGGQFILSKINYPITGLSIVWSQRGEWYRITGDPNDLYPRAELVSRYSTDANAVRELEAEIAKCNLRTRAMYVDALLRATGCNMVTPNFHNDELFAFATATPRQRAEAFLGAMEGRHAA